MSRYGSSSNSFGGGVGGLVRLISGSGRKGLNGGEGMEEVGALDVGSVNGWGVIMVGLIG